MNEWMKALIEAARQDARQSVQQDLMAFQRERARREREAMAIVDAVMRRVIDQTSKRTL